MKFLKLFVCMTTTVMLFTECKEGNTVRDGILSINDSYNSQEVAFEDVATNIRIVPLISDEPIGASTMLQCYGSTTVMRSNDLYSLYFFEDGKMIAKLNKVGRGRGEYNGISDFVYSPARKIVYVLASNKVLKYSVPEMEFIGSLELSTTLNIALHDDTTLICRMTSPDQIPGIYFVNTESGQVCGKLKDICGMSFLTNTDISFYSPDHRILSDGSSLNTISEVSANIQEGEKMILKFNFGKEGLPAKFDSITENTGMDFFMDLTQYLTDHRETVVTEISKAMVRNDTISFWYLSGITGPRHYCRIIGDRMVRYTGFKGTGLKGAIMPTSLTNQGQYVTVIDMLPETLYDDSGDRSEFTSQLETALRSQEFNNPVLVFYDIN